MHYTFNKVLMLQEPLLVVAAFYVLFFTVIVYVRLDFSITKVPGRLRGALALRPSGRHAVAGGPTPAPPGAPAILNLGGPPAVAGATGAWGCGGTVPPRGECRGVGGGQSASSEAPRRAGGRGRLAGRSGVQIAGPWF